MNEHWKGPLYHPALIASQLLEPLQNCFDRIEARAVASMELGSIDTPDPVLDVRLRAGLSESERLLALGCIFCSWALFTWPRHPGYEKWILCTRPENQDGSELIFLAPGLPMDLWVSVPIGLKPVHISDDGRLKTGVSEVALAFEPRFIAEPVAQNIHRFFLETNDLLDLPVPCAEAFTGAGGAL